ncbi:MAG: MFS transporter [Chloroflexi bacterium]|nr:MFS transporter [Chloroflexota bacterium]
MADYPGGQGAAAPRKGTRGHRLLMLVFSFSIAFLLHILLFATAPMATTIMGEMGLSHARFGFVFSIAMASLVIFRLPWGLLADRIGYLRVMRMALLICTAFAFARAFSTSYPTLLLSQFFLGLGLAATMPCLSLLVRESSRRTPGLSTGIYVSGFAAGNAAALGITPYLLHLVSWRHVLFAYAGLAATLCLLWWCLAGSGAKPTSNLQLKSFTCILKDKYVWVLLLFVMAAMGSYDTLATWMPKVLEMKELSTAFASLLPLGFLLAGPIVGLASDRFKDRKTVVALLGLAAALSIGGINYAPVPALLVCLFLAGFTTIGVLTLALAAPVEHEYLSRFAGTVVGLISSLGNVGPLVMPVVFGYLIDVTGTFQTSVLCVAAVAGVAFTLGSRASN